jgi:hypothetical protein
MAMEGSGMSPLLTHDRGLVTWITKSRDTRLVYNMALNINYGAQGSSKSQFSIRVDSLNDVNSQVNRWRTQASALPFRHPARVGIAYNIATFHISRYEATGQRGDLDQAIVGYAEALLRGMSHPLANIVTFEHLTSALFIRFILFGAREDLDHSISYFRHLSNLPLEVAGINRLYVLRGLVLALDCRLKVGGQLEEIEDSISLLRHVITMVPPGTDNYHFFAYNLANT